MKKLYRIYCKIEVLIAACAFFAIIVLTFGNAVLRIFDHPIVANDDICSLLFAWVSFMGADIALRSNRLVGMDILTMNLPVRLQKVLQLIVYAVMMVTLGMFVAKGQELAKMNWARFFNSLPISYGWVTLSLSVCGLMMMMTLVIKIVVLIKQFANDSFTIKMHDPDNEREVAE
ncbi:MAG: TRAP transporter small permease [Otoolea sp.]